MDGERAERMDATPLSRALRLRFDGQTLHRQPRIFITVLAIALIGLWAAWWVESVRRDTLAFGPSTWVPALPFLAGDFKVHIEHVSRIRASGVNPYHKANDYACAVLQYPPMIPRVFSWVAWFDVPTTVRVWIATQGLILTAGALAVWRARRVLGLVEIPPAVMVVAVVFSTPAIYAMERGQSDPLILLPFIASAWLLGRRGAWPEIAAGCLLGATAWLKYYPGVTLFALLALGRRKALAGFVVVAAVIGLVDHDGIRQAIQNGARVKSVLKYNRPPYIHQAEHWIVSAWNSNSFVRAYTPLRRTSATLIELALLLPLVVVVSRKVARSKEPGPVVLPYFLWLTAATTFALPGSNDYNLVVLPLAALAVWDPRDSWRVHLTLGLLLLTWWQPFRLPLNGQVVMIVKLAGLYATGACLVARVHRVPALAGPMHAWHPAAISVAHAPGSRSSSATP